MRARLTAAAVLTAVLGVLAPSLAAADDDIPVTRNFGPGLLQQAAEPDGSSPGSNDWSCRPKAAHPNPVVMLHGTGLNQTVSWNATAARLHNAGYCAFSYTYGEKALGDIGVYNPGGLEPIELSAAELRAFVDKVLAATSASKVDIVGHSQGTLMPSYYVRFLGGGSKVGNYVGLAPLWEGSTAYGLAQANAFAKAFGFDFDGITAPWCDACPQMLSGSDFLKDLHAKGIFDPRVRYTNIVTRFDEIVVPYTNGMADAPNVTNIVLQDKCPFDFSGHLGLMISPNAGAHVLNALDPAHANAVTCQPFFPGGSP